MQISTYYFFLSGKAIFSVILTPLLILLHVYKIHSNGFYRKSTCSCHPHNSSATRSRKQLIINVPQKSSLPVIAALENWRIYTGILTIIFRAILVKISIQMYRFTRIAMTSLKDSCFLGHILLTRRMKRPVHTG